MTNTFGKIFIPIFAALFFIIPVLVFAIIPWFRQRDLDRRRERSNTFELTGITTNAAEINRLPAADFPPHPVIRPDYHLRPSAARLLRRQTRDSRELRNPFVDPPSQNNSINSFRTYDDNRTIPNFSTPTRRGRFCSTDRDLTSFHQTYHMLPSEPTYSAISIPEPAHLPPRSAGRAPSLRPQLERFPLPSTNSDRHLHPNVLFEALCRDKSNDEIVRCTPSAAGSPKSISPLLQAQSRIKQDIDDEISISSMSSIRTQDQDPLPHNSSSTYTFNEPSHAVRHNLPILREVVAPAATRTGAKTPVSAIREMFDRKISADDTIVLPKSTTLSSSIPHSASTTSGKFPRESPPSSPLKNFPSPKILARNRPTPLNLAPRVAKDTPKPLLRASSVYSRDTQGVLLSPDNNSAEGLGAAESTTSSGRLLPQEKAPGGAEWI